MVYREEESVLIQNERVRQSVALAMEGRWDEAVILNREILEASPEDSGTWNRLGKALMELGFHTESEAAFERVLLLAPDNAIAQKNLARLRLQPAKAPDCDARVQRSNINPKAFIGEHGKSTHLELLSCASQDDRGLTSPADLITLAPEAGTLGVYSSDGNYLGLLPTRVGRRLITLIEGGNTYDGAIAAINHDSIRLVIWESSQHPSQRDRISFPVSVLEEPKPIPVNTAGSNIETVAV